MYVAIDTETGGLSKETSLLTAYFGFYNAEFELTAEKYFEIKPKDGIYKVESGGLKVNKINLVELDETATPIEDVRKELRQTLYTESKEGTLKLIPVGQNVIFDIERIQHELMPKTKWDQYISHRVLDTGTIGGFLKLAGKIPMDISGSLGSYGKYLNVEVDDSALHNAKVDAALSISVLKGFLKLLS